LVLLKSTAICLDFSPRLRLFGGSTRNSRLDRFLLSLEWASAESKFRQAFDKNANYAIARSWNGENPAALGRFPGAISEAKLAQETDPLSMSINTNPGWTPFWAGRHGGKSQPCDSTFLSAWIGT